MPAAIGDQCRPGRSRPGPGRRSCRGSCAARTRREIAGYCRSARRRRRPAGRRRWRGARGPGPAGPPPPRSSRNVRLGARFEVKEPRRKQDLQRLPADRVAAAVVQFVLDDRPAGGGRAGLDPTSLVAQADRRGESRSPAAGRLARRCRPLAGRGRRGGGAVAAGHFRLVDVDLAVVDLQARQRRHDVLDHVHARFAASGAPSAAGFPSGWRWRRECAGRPGKSPRTKTIPDRGGAGRNSTRTSRPLQ